MYVYIQERQFDEFKNPRITGGILVRTDRVLEFIKTLSSLGLEKVASLLGNYNR